LHKTRAFLCYCTIQVYIFLSDELPANWMYPVRI
jgi:hypothetical protein